LNLLGELGYHETIRFEKRRARYRYDGCNVELDEMPYLGNFIEIEGPDDRTVLQAIKALGLGDRPLIRSSYVAMLLTWLQEHSIDDRNIRFNSAQPNAAPLKARS
jgi:adenylate cyclase, class 2